MYKCTFDVHTDDVRNISVSDAGKNFAAVVDSAKDGVVFVERRGETQAVVISPAEYERLRRVAEDVDDLDAFDAAMADEGPCIPWARAKVDLGW